MKNIILSLLGLAAATNAPAAVISQWDFNTVPPDSGVGSGTLTPSIGTGVASAVGGVNAVFNTGSPSDPAASGTDNSGVSANTFPAQGTGSGTAGVQFTSSTVGFKDISVSFDLRAGTAASRFYQLQITNDGLTYVNVSAGTGQGATTPGTNSVATISNTGSIQINADSAVLNYGQGFSYTLAGGSASENNANFGFRVVSVFDPAGGTQYVSSNAGTALAYLPSGAIRVDMVTMSGSVIPEPTSLAFLAMGSIVALRRRRRE